MALPAKHLSICFLIFFFFATQIQARESKFFSKFNHYQLTNTIPVTSTNNLTNPTTTSITTKDNSKQTEVPQEQISSVKQEEDPRFTQQTTNGYGLYGRDSNQFPSTTTESTRENTYANMPEDKVFNTGYDNGNRGNYGYETKKFGTSDTRFMDNGNMNNNNNGYETKQYGMSDTSIPENGGNSYKTKQFGMSDTRFMDNGNMNNNNNGYEAQQYGTSDTSFPENGDKSYKTKQFGMSDTRFMDNGDMNNNERNGAKQYGMSYPSVPENGNNGYKTKEFSMSDSRFLDNGNFNNGRETKQYSTSDTSFPENANNNKKNYREDSLSSRMQEGLSDTRFLANGRYFYNVNNENSYLNEYQPVSRSYNGFKPSQGIDSWNKNNYGNNENTYEVNNSMGQSLYQEEQNQEENQDKFSP